jgi:putative ABC transport system substrate-binding protein
MNRRTLLLAGAGLIAATLLHAQSPRPRRVAFAGPAREGAAPHFQAAFRERLRELGWTEGRNIEYVYAYANNDPRLYEPVIAELLAKKPDVLFVPWGPMALVAKKLTQEVPIVFAIASTPEQSGLVASLAKPGGNVTGPSTREREFFGKRVELLREIVPGMRRFAVLGNLGNERFYKFLAESYGRVAQQLGMQVVMLSARSAEELVPAIDHALRERAQAIVGTADVLHFTHRGDLVAHVARARLPMIYTVEEFVEAGGLIFFGIEMTNEFRRAAGYVDRILRGAKPADLPVEEPTHFALTVNLKTARALGITIPQSVLLRATRIIE